MVDGRESGSDTLVVCDFALSVHWHIEINSKKEKYIINIIKIYNKKIRLNKKYKNHLIRTRWSLSVTC